MRSHQTCAERTPEGAESINSSTLYIKHPINPRGDSAAYRAGLVQNTLCVRLPQAFAKPCRASHLADLVVYSSCGRLLEVVLTRARICMFTSSLGLAQIGFNCPSPIRSQFSAAVMQGRILFLAAAPARTLEPNRNLLVVSHQKP